MIAETPGEVVVLPQDRYLLGLMTTLRSAETDHSTFAATVERIGSQLMVAGEI
jgi:uracil phosphoribosyltransferase